MSKVIVIFGAGKGLSASVAKLYGKQGHHVALVARNKEKLELLSDDIQFQGIKTSTYIADLSKPEQVVKVVSKIENQLGRIDVIYYAPNPKDTFTPANELTPEILAPKVDLYFYGLINVINEVLPLLRKNKGGEILTAIGGSAVDGFPFMSGLGPVMAASRNYLQSLQKELIQENIKIGLITISAQIKNSESYDETQSKDSQFPVVHSDDLALLLEDVANDPERLEVFYP